MLGRALQRCIQSAGMRDDGMVVGVRWRPTTGSCGAGQVAGVFDFVSWGCWTTIPQGKVQVRGGGSSGKRRVVTGYCDGRGWCELSTTAAAVGSCFPCFRTGRWGEELAAAFCACDQTKHGIPFVTCGLQYLFDAKYLLMSVDLGGGAPCSLGHLPPSLSRQDHSTVTVVRVPDSMPAAMSDDRGSPSTPCGPGNVAHMASTASLAASGLGEH